METRRDRGGGLHQRLARPPALRHLTARSQGKGMAVCRIGAPVPAPAYPPSHSRRAHWLTLLLWSDHSAIVTPPGEYGSSVK